MKEERIEQLFTETEADSHDRLEEQIRKGIRNNIYRRAMLVVTAALAVIGITLFGIHAVRERNSFHLSDWESVVSEELVQETTERYRLQDSSGTRDILNAQAYIAAYSSIFLPGMVPEFSEPELSDSRAAEYGTYRIGGKLTDYFEVNPENESYRMKAEDNVFYIEIKDGRILADQSGNILNDGSVVLNNLNSYETFSGLQEGEFYSHFRNESTANKTQSYTEKIRKLPESAMVSLDIRLKEPVSVYSLLRSAGNYDHSRIVYAVTVYLPNDEQYEESAIGFSLIGGNGPDRFLESYDGLLADDTLRRDKSYFQQGIFNYNNRASFFGEPKDAALRMEAMYRTQLKLLIDNHLLNEREQRAAEAALAHAEADEVEVIGYRIFASRDDALNILERENTLRSHIVAVKPW